MIETFCANPDETPRLKVGYHRSFRTWFILKINRSGNQAKILAFLKVERAILTGRQLGLSDETAQNRPMPVIPDSPF